MRILKRNLAFVLALVMALSLTVSAMGVEDYSDVNEIAFVEAVDVMTEMGILEGTDGEFNPTKVLNRAEAAKIIAYMLLGKNAADNLQAVTAPFADVPAKHWAAGYIAHCVNEGIINGVSATEYNPNGELTATAFAKMLLSAVGYNVNGEFTGARWETEVNALALKLGVFDGNLGADLGAGCTREEAALYAFNTLMDIETVKYSELLGSYYTGNNAFDTASGTTLNDELYKFSTKNDEDAFGRQGYVWMNAKKKVVTGLYGIEADAVYTAAVKSKTMYADLGLSETTKATVIENGVVSDTTFTVQKNLTKTIGGNGVLVEAYVDDEEVTLVVIDTYLARVAADAEDGEVDVEVFFAADNVVDMTYETEVAYAKGDYVLVTVEMEGEDSIQSMKAVETVEGILDAKAGTYVKFEGEKYNHSANLVKAAIEDADTDVKTVYATNYKNDMVLMLDEYGYAIGLVEADAAETEIEGYVLVTESQIRQDDLFVDNAARVKVLHLDGTGYEVMNMATRVNDDDETEVKLPTKWEEIDNIQGAPVARGFYGYYMIDDAIALVALDNTDATPTEHQTLKVEKGDVNSIVANGKQNLTVTGLSGKVMNSNTVLNLVDADSIETVEGYKNIKINETNVDVLVVYSNRIVKEIYVVNGSIISDDIYAYYNGGALTEEKINDSTWITLYINEEVEQYKITADTKISYEYNDGSKGTGTLIDGVYVIEVDGDELVSMTRMAAEKAWNEGNWETITETVTTAKDLYFNTNKASYLTYAEDVKVFDMTEDGLAGVVEKGDTVVYVTDRKNNTDLVTYVYILAHSTKDTDVEEGVVVTPGITFTVTKEYVSEVETGKVTFEHNVDGGKVNVSVYNADLGKTVKLESGITGSFKAAATGEYTFELVDANGDVVATRVIAIIVK